MDNWLEVSLTVSGELAEAVADVLARFAPNGVTTEQAVEYVSAESEGIPVGPVTVRAYLPVDKNLEERRHKLEEALYYLGTIQPLPAPVFTLIADRDWMEAWKVHYRPIPIGKKLIIVPSWLESPDATRIPVKINPGMAFGTGTHPTTQLCLEFIEQFFDRGSQTVDREPAIIHRPPSTVIDVGCGSGILSVAALKLGASYALGVDIDEAAIRASRECANANGIAAQAFSLGLGSVTEILAGNFPIRQAPLVLANILAPVIVRLFDLGLAELVSPGGRLILSGILQEQADSVVSAAAETGMKLVEKRQSEDWVALAFER
jgi:ribosomal protein L11 methyltransferase